MKKLGIVVGAAPVCSERVELFNLIKNPENYKIAADGGIALFLEAGVCPDHWLGDMDSVKDLENSSEYAENPLFEKILKTILPCEKDDTDMALAVKRAVEEGCNEIMIFGGTGGKRMSHTFANIQLLHHYAELGIKITMVGENCRTFVLYNNTIQYDAAEKGLISIIALNDKAEGVTIKGLFYEFSGTLTNTFALGVSNQFVGKEAVVAVENGALLIIKEE